MTTKTKPRKARVLKFGKSPELSGASSKGKPGLPQEAVGAAEELNQIYLQTLVDDLGAAEEAFRPYAHMPRRIEAFRRELRHQTTDAHPPYEPYTVEGEEFTAILSECGETHTLTPEIVRQAAQVLPEDVWWRIVADDVGVGKLKAALYAVGRSLRTVDVRDGTRRVEVVRRKK